MITTWKHHETIEKAKRNAEQKIVSNVEHVEHIALVNQKRVLDAFKRKQVSEHHFTPSTGYGYDDLGRETLEAVYADVFGAETALVRPQIISGTHAIATVLFGLLRPGDELLYITGKPYDTLEEVIGIRGEEGGGSLKDFGITYHAVPLTAEQKVDKAAVKAAMNERTKVIGIQRSKGYADRPSFSINEIEQMAQFVKGINPNVIVFVDNCYGEFVEAKEPCHVGVDVIAGSLIKNPGGGIVKTGGYVAGKAPYVKQASYRLAAPGIGTEGGATLYSLLEMFQGLFLAPHVVSQAVKGAHFTAAFLDELGMRTSPRYDEQRTDLIQSVQFPDREKMIAFCQAIQAASPIDAHVTPQPSSMPGYEDPVIMAAGTFIQGASIELTADGPVRPPYIAYVQGGLTYEHVKLAVMQAADEMLSLETKGTPS
ncbi:aminotransferase class I/II-fold pyridoxal phosphate-dependent enzyme [Halalkalibacterium halodurans]|jgi:cystathionine beta-lyase family protein involved in aluminum resistance|uniref:Cystathionine beta-lyase family protein involved in aluminum resistance n=1 Tax=Halalkalibacterium halodurans TaxID=86665 RepID=A0A0M0KJ62_ALKHA|nr:aminotransferase class I/II-fold pyridoxal phosphate-dependent enzyme [Halalkalibacterium halodurans]MED4162103.1 aminotransferase class I/II-fold pyridoxal phosphate-dependent enzyme [Halalkalibacterium halodurans]TES50121.1 aminotransferase class I/II-fold pyridoxal phosphate-dependent enzyme [Halalkalibacterium halodurans]TPE66472.1 aminotransferase class I/II-fold pyridoxal phosphate-dependent enzyme [Halalkalibacterium halodurans]